MLTVVAIDAQQFPVASVGRIVIVVVVPVMDGQLTQIDAAELARDEECARFENIPSLVRLDLRRTQVSFQGLDRLCQLPHLEEVHIQGCPLSWLQTWRLKLRFRSIQFLKQDDLMLDASPRTRIDNPLEWALQR